MKYHFKTQMIKLEELFTSEMSCVVYLQHGGCTLIYCYLSQQLRADYSGSGWPLRLQPSGDSVPTGTGSGTASKGSSD